MNFKGTITTALRNKANFDASTEDCSDAQKHLMFYMGTYQTRPTHTETNSVTFINGQFYFQDSSILVPFQVFLISSLLMRSWTMTVTVFSCQ